MCVCVTMYMRAYEEYTDKRAHTSTHVYIRTVMCEFAHSPITEEWTCLRDKRRARENERERDTHTHTHE